MLDERVLSMLQRKGYYRDQLCNTYKKKIKSYLEQHLHNITFVTRGGQLSDLVTETPLLHVAYKNTAFGSDEVSKKID